MNSLYSRYAAIGLAVIAMLCAAVGTARAQGATFSISPGAVGSNINDPNSGGGLSITIVPEPMTMAFCRPGGYPSLQVNYTIMAPGQTVLHRVGVEDPDTRQDYYDVWQQTYVENTAYPVRYLPLPPQGHRWIPFVEVYGWQNGQWQLAFRQAVPVDYQYSACG